MGFTQWPSNSTSGVPTYANFAALPASATDGDAAITLDTHSLYVYDATIPGWRLEATGNETVVQMGALDGGTPSSTGADVGSNSLWLQSASPLWPGLVSSASQTFAGNKTFLDAVVAANITGSNTGDVSFTAIGTTPNLQGASVGTGQVVTLQPASATFGGVVSTASQTFQGNKTFNGFVIASNITGSNTGDVSLGVVGTAPAAQAASFSGQVLTLQPADATNPGVVSSAAQTFAGVKTFSVQTLFADGTSSLPGIAFSGEISSGMYRLGSGSFGLSVAGDLAIHLRSIAPGTVNVGINSSASASNTVPFSANRTLNGTAFYQWGNLSNGTLSGTVFQVSNGPSANYTTIENFANSTGTASGYFAGGSAFLGGINQLSTVYGNEFNSTASFVGFVTRGRQLVHERMRLNEFGLVLRGGLGLTITGSSISGGGITHFTNNSTSSYSLTWPGAQGAAGTAPVNNGSGVLSWTATLTNPMTQSGDMVVGSGAGVASRLAAPATSSVSMLTTIGSGASAYVPTWRPYRPPNVVVFNNGAQGVYTVSSGVQWILVELVGGGGGGTGSGSGSTGGTSGGETSFGSATANTLCIYGLGGGSGGTGGGFGGSAAISSGSADMLAAGSPGILTSGATSSPGGNGGNSFWGGGGRGGNTVGSSGLSAFANSGSGGGGGGGSPAIAGANGGGAGGYVRKTYSGPFLVPTYNYSVGNGGAGGSVGSGGGQGGAGAAGTILIYEHFV